MKKSEKRELLEIFNSIFKKVGINTVYSAIDDCILGNITYEELLEILVQWNKDFNLNDFLKSRGASIISQSVKIGDNFYVCGWINSLGKSKVYREDRYYYQIILNPTSSSIRKDLYANVAVMEFESEKKRDRELDLLIDKLNLIGIRFIY